MSLNEFPKPCKVPYLLWCVHEHIEFRLPEIKSLINMLKLNVEWIETPSEEPFMLVYFESEQDAIKLLSRTVLIRSVYELWAQGNGKKELISNLKLALPRFASPYCGADQSFKLQVESYGKKLSLSTKVKKMEDLDFLPFEGPVQLNNPKHVFGLFEFYGMDPNNAPDEACKLFFGRWICDGQRRIINEINLSQRKFIGNTSMDPTLSLIMANMAQVQTNDLILDPFVGSGSLLVAAAKFGGKVLGTDLDYLMLLGKAKPSRCNRKTREPDESVQINMQQYNLQSQFLDVVVADASLPLWRNNLNFDAIITDPPYGIREATEKIGSKKKYKIPGHLAEKHIPSKIDYSLQDVFIDLLNFSANELKVGGRLVYWLPVFREDFSEKEIPSHPCLKLVGYSEQTLSRHTSRFLVTMQKINDVKNTGNISISACVSDTTKSFREKYFQGIKVQSNEDADDL